jgi:hypothetical protein
LPPNHCNPVFRIKPLPLMMASTTGTLNPFSAFMGSPGGFGAGDFSPPRLQAGEQPLIPLGGNLRGDDLTRHA